MSTEPESTNQSEKAATKRQVKFNEAGLKAYAPHLIPGQDKRISKDEVYTVDTERTAPEGTVYLVGVRSPVTDSSKYLEEVKPQPN